MNITDFLSRLPSATRSGNGWSARCPAHDDQRASLAISIGKEGRVLIRCHAGCTVETVLAAVGLTVKDLFNNTPMNNSTTRTLEVYEYIDEAGTLLFQVCRLDPKDFRQRAPDASAQNGWRWSTKGVRRVPYRLPELIAAAKAGQTIFVVEGEKDVDAMVAHGFVATCNPGGAGKWRTDYNAHFAGASAIVVIADKDPPGRKHARTVARSLCNVAPTVKVVELPDREEKPIKDVSDFFAAGGTPDELRAIVEAAAPLEQPKRRASDDAQSGEDDEPDSDDGEKKQEASRKSAATRLVKLAEQFPSFHDPQNHPFVRLTRDSHTEIWPVDSAKFRDLLSGFYYRQTHSVITRNALTDVIATLAGKARFDAPEEPVFRRIAWHRRKILIDLCDPHWRVIEITASGWTALEKSPVAFIRTGTMRPLPEPAKTGSLKPLWELLNLAEGKRPLLAGALLNAFHPDGPYFVVNFVGEQGTAKSCATKILRNLIDPNETPLRSPSREERDLLTQATKNWVVVLDNLSSLPPWLSDSLCRLSTGGGHSARQLYTDGEEFSLSVKRPVIMNGIDDVAIRPDLAERALQIELEMIPDDRRMPEKALWRKFEAARPVIFAAILDGLSCALRELPNVNLAALPRMADAVLWAVAGETALGFERGTFISAYRKHLDDGAVNSVEAHVVGVGIRQLLSQSIEWSGEPAKLLAALNKLTPEETQRARTWPRSPRALSSCVHRLAPALRKSGFEVEFSRGKRRSIRLCNRADFASGPTPASPPFENTDANDAGVADVANLPALHGPNTAEPPNADLI